MRAFVDTNIFIYATYSLFKEHKKALVFLKDCVASHDLWHLSYGVIYEYLNVVTKSQLFHGVVLSLADAVANVQKFCEAGNVSILGEAERHLDNLIALDRAVSVRNNLIHDAHSVVIMNEHDLKIVYTADTDFHRFKGIEVRNPLV